MWFACLAGFKFATIKTNYVLARTISSCYCLLSPPFSASLYGARVCKNARTFRITGVSSMPGTISPKLSMFPDQSSWGKRSTRHYFQGQGCEDECPSAFVINVWSSCPFDSSLDNVSKAMYIFYIFVIFLYVWLHFNLLILENWVVVQALLIHIYINACT